MRKQVIEVQLYVVLKREKNRKNCKSTKVAAFALCTCCDCVRFTRVDINLDEAVQVEFERQTLKPVFTL